ncbi:guanine nucleotide-binding protein-like 3-like protein [Hylobates moloch]|uniref:guanine nucleotide-binding protein-like 3-like protein n=1 Tax=Hylobates moloch TaxID=81572 RepID=UPI0026748C87|nr:guanine nucleotide-binding protein-like 3-like protein [Hylobates moloch]
MTPTSNSDEGIKQLLPMVGGKREPACTEIITWQIGDLTGYCTNPNRHQMGWAKRNVDHRPKSNNMVDVCSVDRRPVLQRIMETDPLQQGQALASALKNKKKMQKRADKIASKLSDSMMSALDLSGNADDGVGD